MAFGVAADRRREERRRADHEHEPGQQPRRERAGVGVPHDGHRDDRAARGGEALQHAQRHELTHAGDPGAQQREDHVHGDPAERGQASPEPVGERPDEQLTHSPADERARDGELDAGRGEAPQRRHLRGSRSRHAVPVGGP